MGDLRKRKKRNIIKVKKTGRTETSKPLGLTSCTSISETGERSRQMRVTRNPNFHLHSVITSHKDKLLKQMNSLLGKNQFQRTNDISKNNPALIDKLSMNRLQLIIYLSMISGALPWSWDKANYQIIRWEGGFLKFWWIQYSLITFQTICLTGFQLWVFLKLLEGEGISYREIFMSSLSVYWYLFACLFRLIVYMSQEKMRCYINSMLHFNRIHVEKYLLHLDGYEQGGKIIMNLTIPLTCCQVGSSLSFFILFPGQAWYLTSYLPHKDWYWLIPGALQDVIVLASDISLYMLMSWMIVAHAVTADFWLRESHNSNETDFTSNELRRLDKAVGIHRALSVLNSSFNDCMSGLPISNMKLTIMSGAIICGYVMVRSMNHLFIDEFPSIMIYPVGVINCFATGFGIISISAHINELGTSFVDSWTQNGDKNLRRILMSCSTIKVWVGRFYYVTVATIITFCRIIVDQITNCILTFP